MAILTSHNKDRIVATVKIEFELTDEQVETIREKWDLSEEQFEECMTDLQAFIKKSPLVFLEQLDWFNF
jgi:chaperonin cofactor prefoldin